MKEFISNLERTDSEIKDEIEVETKIYSLKGSQLKTLEKTIALKSDFYNLISSSSESLLIQKFPIKDKLYSGIAARAYSCEGLGKVASDSTLIVYNENTFEYEKRQSQDTVEIEFRTEIICLKGISPQDWISDNFLNESRIVKTKYGYIIPSGYQKRAPLYIILRAKHLIISNNPVYLSSTYLRISKAKQKEAINSLLIYEFGKVDWNQINDSKEFFELNSILEKKNILSRSFKIKKKQLVETIKAIKKERP